VWVGWDGRMRAVIVVSDTIKETSAEAIDQLRELGLRPVLLTTNVPHTLSQLR